jgi:hypothetical protein
MFCGYPELPDVACNDGTGVSLYLGQRWCPNTSCYTHLFLIFDSEGKIRATYPAARIPFDTADIPPSVCAALEEAITCYANECFVAAAIMVRKSLEELCDAQNATGGNLKEKIEALSKTLLLPRDLLEGLDDIRLLGNDAAHVQSSAFKNVGQDEVALAIEFSQEVLKATYQYRRFVDRLRALKTPRV